MSASQVIIIIAVILVLGIVIFPLINRRQFRNLSYDQQIRILMKEATGLSYFKNVSRGSSGTLFYVKNRRKILILPWKLSGGNMVISKKAPPSNWDYPEEHEKILPEEYEKFAEELEKLNKKSAVKIIFEENEK